MVSAAFLILSSDAAEIEHRFKPLSRRRGRSCDTERREVGGGTAERRIESVVPAIGRLRYLDAAPSEGRVERGVGRPSTADTLVLIHAFPVHARMWEPQLSLSDRGWRIIAPHLRGFGDDAGTGDSPVRSMDDYAADIIDLLDGLGIEKAVIGGLSLGGYVAFAVFRRAPHYFRAMVLADTRPQPDTSEGLEGRKRMLRLVEAAGPQGVADELVPKLLGNTTRQQRPDIVELVRAQAMSSSVAAIEGAIHAMMSRPDSTPLLGSIHCPTLVLVGEEDVLTPPEVSREMQRAIPGSHLVVVQGAGHLSNVEQPHQFNAALADFLTNRV